MDDERRSPEKLANNQQRQRRKERKTMDGSHSRPTYKGKADDKAGKNSERKEFKG